MANQGLRKIVIGEVEIWKRLSEKPFDQIIDLAARSYKLKPIEIASGKTRFAAVPARKRDAAKRTMRRPRSK